MKFTKIKSAFCLNSCDTLDMYIQYNAASSEKKTPITPM